MKRILLLIFLLVKISPLATFYYTSRFNLISYRTLPETIGNFMELNEVLNNSTNTNNINSNNLRIRGYKNNSSMSFKYNRNNYNHRYLFIDKDTYYARYNFIQNNNDYRNKYLFKLKIISFENENKNENKNQLTLIDVKLKYNNDYLSQIPNIDRIICDHMNFCVNKKPKQLNHLLKSYFILNKK